MAASNGGALPVVDMAPFFAGDGANDEGARARATEAMREACQATGFFRAVNHGVPPELMTRALELSVAFFALPDEEKAKVRPAEGASASPLPSGYARQPAHSADKNEYILVFNPKLLQNEFPAEPAGFSDALEECYARLSELGVLIQDILNECMGLPRGHLAGYNADRAFDFLIALRYFPATSAEEINGLSAHEDGNCVTFVLQDGVGGLEVLGDDGRWVPAEPVEGSIVVNLGDVLQVLTNKRFKSATHRVVRTPGVHRHSLVFALSLDGDKWVEPLPEFTGDVGEPPRYRGFRYDEYLQMRMRNKTQPPSRPEDVVHVTHYEI